MISLEQSLVPASSLIDGRTERDWLSFLCDYASLINFYDGNNLKNGNWAPFLLKDPVFLLASISKTRFAEIYSRYINTCANLARLLKANTDVKDIAFAFNQLFDQITGVFILIRRWIYFMQRTDDDYDLKSYVIYQISVNFSKYFWAIISLQQSLYLSSVIPGISPVDHSNFDSFDYHEGIIWKQNKDKSPYWEILNLHHPIKNNTNADFFNALKKAGDNLFVFFHTIIRSADAEFVKLQGHKSRFPDVTLLRTFVNLLKVEQDQLNGISQKHLEFYYKDILKQTGKPGVPDSVFLCSTLAKSTSTFNLPAGTLFNAGVDAQKNPIAFSTSEAVNLNPAAITGGYTLSVLPGTDSALSLRNLPPPGVLQKDKDGKVQSWAAFWGSTSAPPVISVKPAFAFSSPILLLREGKRNISLELDFASAFDRQLLVGASYYLSTQNNGWLEVTGTFQPPITAAIVTSKITVNIEVESAAPPIEPFLINPDGLDSSWPMLKIELGSCCGQAESPVLNSLIVKVDVSNVKTFQLYNDYGALSTKTSYPPFGPIPLVNSSFIIGSNEIFSKPVSPLIIELCWDNLPPDFSTYYQQYNEYLYPPPPICSICQTIKNWFIKPNVVIDPDMPFNNGSFKVDFSLLNDGAWETFDMAEMAKNPDANSKPKFIPYQDAPDVAQPIGKNVPLFVEDDRTVNGQKLTLADLSIFGYSLCPAKEPILSADTLNDNASKKSSAPALNPPDPDIQNSTLSFTDSSQSGFMKITISGPSEGFGSSIYPNVVSNIALQNAMIISNDSDLPFSTPASLPFAPQLSNFTANYSATYQYIFNPATTNTYPIQCFVYSPLKNYQVFENSEQNPGDNSKQSAGHTRAVSKSAVADTTPGLPLLTSLNYNDYLFLEITDLLPANALNLYFDLARSYSGSSTNVQPDYYYVSSSGWKTLPLLSDGTNNFTCSGIVKVSVPDDIANDGVFMPGNNYWFCIAANSDTSLFAQIVFLSTNGFIAHRTGSFTSITTIAPKLAAGAITKPQIAIPQLAATVQPFSSFGGKAAETNTQMNQRVSNRLKTKDRAISPANYFTLIRQEFDDIYYARPVFDRQLNSIVVYAIKAYDSWTAPNAFLPLITQCKEEKISTFLKERTSIFTDITVSNFVMQYVYIIAEISIDEGFEELDIKKNVNAALNIFLSPWIVSSSRQVIIGQEISGPLVSDFIKNVGGVSTVESVYFQTWTADKPVALTTPTFPGEKTVAPLAEKNLLVSCMDHNITFKHPAT